MASRRRHRHARGSEGTDPPPSPIEEDDATLLVSRFEARLHRTGVGASEVLAQPTRTILRPSEDFPTIRTEEGETASRSPDERLKEELREALAELREPLRLEAREALGEGGMGVVERGVQRSLAREVAIKSLRRSFRSPKQSLELLREARLTGSLEHPNVVPVYDLGLGPEGELQVALKRIEGTEWKALMHDPAALAARGVRDRLAWNLRVFQSVLNAVELAHSRGVIHRDIKPENVMIGAFGEVYLLDWGIAITVEEAARIDPRSEDGEEIELVGTPAYMAPEMAGAVAAPIGLPTDLYLLGATLYEAVVGAAPHRGRNLAQIMMSILDSEPAIGEEVPAELAQILRRAMQREPADRYPSVAAMRTDIELFLERRGARQLAERARESLRALLEAIPRLPRQTLYGLYGECRFGLQQALDAWPENEEAARDLGRAVEAMARYELAEGEPKAAEGLLGQHPAPPAELAEEIRRALAAAEEARASTEARLLAQDRAIGRAARGRALTLLSAVGLLLALVPLFLGDLYRGTTAYLLDLGGIALLVLSWLVLVLTWRRLLARLPFDQDMLKIGVAFMASQLLLEGVHLLAGLPHHRAIPLQPLLWGLTSAYATVAADRWFYLPAAINFGAFAYATLMGDPFHANLARVIGVLSMLIAMALVWREGRKAGSPPGP